MRMKRSWRLWRATSCGGSRPVFFYGQAYMGSLDAFLVAGAFAIFGQQVWVIRLVQSLLYLGVLLTSAWLGRVAFSSWKVGVLAMLLLAIPAVNVTLVYHRLSWWLWRGAADRQPDLAHRYEHRALAAGVSPSWAALALGVIRFLDRPGCVGVWPDRGI